MWLTVVSKVKVGNKWGGVSKARMADAGWDSWDGVASPIATTYWVWRSAVCSPSGVRAENRPPNGFSCILSPTDGFTCYVKAKYSITLACSELVRSWL